VLITITVTVTPLLGCGVDGLDALMDDADRVGAGGSCHARTHWGRSPSSLVARPTTRETVAPTEPYLPSTRDVRHCGGAGFSIDYLTTAIMLSIVASLQGWVRTQPSE